MKHFTVQCPNCGSNIQGDQSHKTTSCHYCGTQVYTTTDHILSQEDIVDGKNLSEILKKVRDTINSNNHRNAEFKDLLLKAVQEDFIKKEIQEYIDSEIWNAEIKNNELKHYYGDIKKFIVPRFIKRIENNAFSEAIHLEAIYIHDNVENIEEGIFISNTSDIKIYTNALNTTAAKYAAINDIRFEIIGRAHTAKVFSGRFGDFYMLFSQISEMKRRKLNVISIHYDNMYKSQEYKIDSNVLRNSYRSLSKIKKAKEYDLKKFNFKFCNYIGESFEKHGNFENFQFWNKTPGEINADANLLQSVFDDLKNENIESEFLYDKYSWFSPNPSDINDYDMQQSHWKAKKFIEMLID